MWEKALPVHSKSSGSWVAPSLCLVLLLLGGSWKCQKWDPACVHGKQCIPQSWSYWVTFLYPTHAYQFVLANIIHRYCSPCHLSHCSLLYSCEWEMQNSIPAYSMKFLLSLWSNISRWKTGLIWWLSGQWVPARIEWGRFSLQELWTPKHFRAKCDYYVFLHISELNRAFGVQRMSSFCYRSDFPEGSLSWHELS